MTAGLGLAPVPASVERHLSGTALGNQVLAAVRAETSQESAERSRLSVALPEPRPARLQASSAAEELACFLDVARPDVNAWLSRMAEAIEETFMPDAKRVHAALSGLEVVQKTLTYGTGDALAPALAEFDSLLHGLCVGLDVGGPIQG